MMRKHYAFLLLSCFAFLTLTAQKPDKPTASELYHELQKVNFLGSALYIAAHPDDENTRLISFLSNDVKARTAYLSMTRGDGGQNLIGPEIRELLGVIRTQELLAARRTDGGEQMFTRANDFGYSKHPDETLVIWNKDEVLSDVVRAIRKFKPDVIINRFNHRDPGSNHGHHTSSAMLSVEAFDLVGDENQFPETAQKYGAWQPKRLFLNTGWFFYGSREAFAKADKSNLMEIETGSYYSDLGQSNGEIASSASSMHKSQGFGRIGQRGTQSEWLEFLKGDFPEGKVDMFEGVDTSWNRVKGGKQIGEILYSLEANFDFKDPSSMIPELLKAYELVNNLEDNHWRELKSKQLENLILNSAGIFLEAVSKKQSVNPRENVAITVEALNRSIRTVLLKDLSTAESGVLIDFNKPLANNEKAVIEAAIPFKSLSTLHSTPYWLAKKGTLGMYNAPEPFIGLPETPEPYEVIFNLNIDGTPMSVKRPVVYKFGDRVKGEVYRPFEVLPEITSSIADKVWIFSSVESKEIPVILKAGKDKVSGTVTLQHPEGWKVNPSEHTFTIVKSGEERTLVFTVTPPEGQSEGNLRPLVQLGSSFYQSELIEIDYEHIPFQSVLLPSEAKVVRIPIEKKGSLIGYVEGAGDAIPESLKQIGYEVVSMQPSEITAENLERFDAVVMGVRAYNTVPELGFKQVLLNEYVKAGGTLVIQYNTSRGLVTEDLAPYPLKLSRDRVTDENSAVQILAPDHTVLNNPNKITQDDFKGWVQERGLYFPSEWAPEFTPILGMSDKDYPQSQGSLLVAKYGEGHYIYTGLSFFRELPAGVPGAYRLFANLLSIGK